MQPFASYADLLTCIQDNGHTLQILGRAPDGQPIVAVKSGGDKTPAIFISAGSHATEQAGVSAACALIDEIETEHQIYTIPSRDPIGMNGLAYALGLSLDEAPHLGGLADVAPLLRKRGQVLYEEGDTVVALIGEYGYATSNLYNHPVGDWIEALKGRRLYFPASNPGVERGYTLIIDPTGEVLHLNRFPRHPLGTRRVALHPRPNGRHPTRLDAGPPRARRRLLLVFSATPAHSQRPRVGRAHGRRHDRRGRCLRRTPRPRQLFARIFFSPRGRAASSGSTPNSAAKDLTSSISRPIPTAPLSPLRPAWP